MVRDAFRSSRVQFRTFIVLALMMPVVSTACDGCKDKPKEPDAAETTTVVDTGPEDTGDPLAEAKENAEEEGVAMAVHLSDLSRAVGAEIEAQSHRPRRARPNIKREPETGKLARSQLNKVFNLHAAAMKKCYERSLKKSPGLQGKVRVELRIRSNGRVRAATVRGISLDDSSVHNCMEREAMTMKFPEPDGGAVRVVKTYSFFPEL